MSTGAILARGGCRALKWVALFGAVLALGIGTASAQPVGVTVTGPSGNMVNEGDNATYTVTVTGYVPAGTATSTDVVVTLALPAPGSTAATAGEAGDITTNRGLAATITGVPANPTPATTGLLFTGSATVIIGTTHDLDAEDEEFTIGAPALTDNHLETTAAGSTALPVPTTGFPTVLTIKDDETQSYDLTLDAGQTPDEGEAINLTLTANPAHEDGAGTVSVYLDVQPTVATITSGATATLNMGNRDDPVVIMPVANDKNRSTDTIVVSAYTPVDGSPTPRLVSELSIEVKDGHVLPGADAVTVKGIWDSMTGGEELDSVTEGGDAVYVEFEVDRGTGGTTEELELELAVNPSREAASYRFNDEVTFLSGSGKQTRRLELRALSDEFVNDAMLTLSFELTGEAGNGTNETDAAKNSTSGMLAPITVVNGTTTQIEAKPEAELTTAVDAAIAAGTGEDGVNPGESFSVKVADLFATAPAGALYTARSSSSAVSITTTGGTVADGTLTVMASSVGEATVTVTGSVNPASSARPLPQVDSTTAQVEFDVTVVNKPLRVDLTADPAAMVDEGGKITLAASANRPVLAGDDATVSLQVVGPVDEPPASIVIAVGESSNTVDLQVTDDSVVKELGAVTVIASGGSLRVDPTRLEIDVIENDQPTPVVPTVRAKDGAAGMIASAIATVAGGSPWMVGGMAATVDMSMLFDLDDGVTAAYSGVSSDDDVVRAISSGKTLTLTPMGAGSATITVTGSDTAGGGVATVTHDAAVALQTLVVTVTASADMVDEGGSVTVTATANRAVTEATMLDVTVTGDTDAVSADESITIAMGETMGSATVTAVEDADSDDANVTVVVGGGSLSAPATFNIAITDNDPTVAAKSQAEATAVFVTAVAMAGGADGWLPGGEAASVDMSELFTPNGSPTLEYEAMSSAAETVAASASGSMLTLTPMETGEATITVTATDTSGDAADTATVMGTVTVGVLPLEVMVSPATAEVTEGGGAVEITATANKMVDANVEVMLIRDAASSAGEDDYSLEPVMITIMAGEVMGKTMLMAEDDYEVEGTESLTLVARVKDMGDIGSVMVSIMDNDMTTTYTLTGPMDMNIVEGMSYELTATASQAVRADTTVMLVRDRAASDAADGDYSVESITIMAGETSGTTMLMVTEDNTPDGGTGTNMGESLVLIGSVDGMEIGSLTFTIWDAAVPALPVIAQLLLAGLLGIGGYRRYRRR